MCLFQRHTLNFPPNINSTGTSKHATNAYKKEESIHILDTNLNFGIENDSILGARVTSVGLPSCVQVTLDSNISVLLSHEQHLSEPERTVLKVPSGEREHPSGSIPYSLSKLAQYCLMHLDKTQTKRN